MQRCLIGIGSNLADPAGQIEAACSRLQADPRVAVIARSRCYHSPAVGGPKRQADFQNAAILIDTDLQPCELLAFLQQVENEAGRMRDERWAARTLDLDLLLYDQRVQQDPLLTLPHPRMSFRRFVLLPAAEIAADMIHPTSGLPISKLLRQSDAREDYVAICGCDPRATATLIRELQIGNLVHGLFATPDDGRDELHSTSPTLPTALELLTHQVDLIDAEKWQSGDRFAASDFWFDSLLDFARTSLSASEFAQFQIAWDKASSKVVPPKLVVLLDSPHESLTANEHPASMNQRISRQQCEQLAERLRDRAFRHAGAMLHVDSSDPRWIVQEVSAALQAMR